MSVLPLKIASGQLGQSASADSLILGTDSSLAGNPTTTTQAPGDSSTKIATTAFVAAAISGVNPAVAVAAATTSSSDTSGLTYSNGASGIGATFTGSNNTPLVIDGITINTLGQRVLVKNDTQSPSGAFNGVYSLTTISGPLTAPILTRATDYDQSSDINSTGAIPVISGTANSSTSWVLTSAVTNVGTDPLTYAQFSYAPSSIVQNNAGNTYSTGSQDFTSATQLKIPLRGSDPSSSPGSVWANGAVIKVWDNAGTPAKRTVLLDSVTAAQMLALSSGDIYVGNGSNQPAAVAMSGDATMDNTGAVTLANTAVTATSYTNTNLTVDSKGRITAASNGSAGSSTFQSSDQTITASGTLTLAHGLGAVPKNVWMQMVCQTANLGYTTGQIVQRAIGTAEGGNGVWVIVDSTNLNVYYGANGQIPLLNLGTQDSANIVAADWKCRFFAST